MLSVCILEFVEFRSDLLISTWLEKLINDCHDSRVWLAIKCHRFGFVDIEWPLPGSRGA